MSCCGASAALCPRPLRSTAALSTATARGSLMASGTGRTLSFCPRPGDLTLCARGWSARSSSRGTEGTTLRRWSSWHRP
eukprot:10668990-Lingulodinium_polyedra.AAC.1